MKIKLVFLSGALAVSAGCGAQRALRVPEVSPPLIQEEVFVWNGTIAGNMLFPCANGISWVDPSGQIVAWNPDKKTGGAAFRLPFAVSDPPFRQGDFLALKSQTDDQWLVFDLAGMKIRFALRDLRASRILAVDGDHLVYLEGENLVVYSWRKPAGIFRVPTAGNTFFNCHFRADRILIMGSRQLFVFLMRNGKFQSVALPVEATGESLCLGKYVYYSASGRQLVKYSPASAKPAWKMKLGHDLKRRPLVQAGTVVVSPADNNVLQLSNSGSVRWWLALGSILDYDLLPMAGHLAAFLLDREIKFIDLRRRQVTGFAIGGRPAGTPLVFKNDLYFMLAAGPVQKLQRVGNRYGIEVTLAPEVARWPGMPLTVSFQTSNLLKPRVHCVIRDQSGQAVLVKEFANNDRGQLVWLPKRAGIYRARLSAVALNRSEEKEVSFQVFDPRQLIALFNFLF
jgi:hypothetical protein